MGFFWGEAGESCHTTCERYGQICNAEWTHNNILPDNENYEAFLDAATLADRNSEIKLDVAGNLNCTDASFELHQDSAWPLVRPNPSNYACGGARMCTAGTGECGTSDVANYGYSCAKISDTGDDGYHRMCYCLPGTHRALHYI